MGRACSVCNDTAKVRNGPSKVLAETLAPYNLDYSANEMTETTVAVIVDYVLSVIVKDDGDYSVASFKAAVQDDLVRLKMPQPAAAPAPAPPNVDNEDDDGDATSDGADYDSDDDDEYDRVRKIALPTALPDDADDNTPTLVVDLGYSTTIFGFPHEADAGPTAIPTAVDRSKTNLIERHKLNSCDVDWEGMEALWDRLYDTELQLDASDANVLCTISPYGPTPYPQHMCEMLHVFESMHAPGNDHATCT